MRISRLGWLALPFVTSLACGGTASRDSETDPTALIQDVCGSIAAEQCSSDYSAAECQADLQSERDDAIQRGCGAQFDGVLGCFAQITPTCDGYPEGACEPEGAALAACDSPPATWKDECSQAHGGFNPAVDAPGYEQCEATCPAWKLDCEKKDAASPMICTCTAGPNAGASFETTACKGITLEVGLDFCG